MAKGQKQEPQAQAETSPTPEGNPNMNTETQTPVADAAAAAAVPTADAPKANKQGAAILLEGGEKRVDYIKRRWKEGATRSQIAKELNVPYQIVFASTKNEKPADPNAPAKAPSGRVPVTFASQQAKAAAEQANVQVAAELAEGQSTQG